IYALEDAGPRGEAVRRALRKVDVAVASSPLALQECLVGPLRERNLEVRDRYIELFDHLEVIEVDAAVFIRAAEVQADYGLKTPDAV
ncbi:type II toxin-antitoxin system VapC family toxin, partial [Pseudomonas sp. BGM005]|nr:type II toxin-antitoxin system VapC family toxin [Pseudomonas sp. BG5]